MGLSGYDEGQYWSILTKANLDPSTLDYWCLSGGTTITSPCDPVCLVKKEQSFSVGFSACTNTVGQVTYFGNFPSVIQNIFTTQYEEFDGDLSTLQTQVNGMISDVITSDNVYAEDETIRYFGSIPQSDYDMLSGFTAATNVFAVDNLSFELSNLASPFNDSWYYALFTNNGNTSYSGYSFFTTVSGLTLLNPVTTSSTSTSTTTTTTNPCVTPTPITTTTTTTPVPVYCYSGTVVGMVYYYTGTSFTQYDDLIVATLRSRGNSPYSDGTNPVYEITGVTDVTYDMTGEYSGVSKNPFLSFGINATNYEGTNFSFEVSLSSSDSQNINKVFGRGNFEKPRTQVPLMVEEYYQTLLNYAWSKGYIRGLSAEVVSTEGAQSDDFISLGLYLYILQ